MYCALRDGVVGSVDHPLTKASWGVAALALLTGEEVDGPTLGMVEYTRVGTAKDMMYGLLGCRRSIRVLRGSNLKSKYAPKAGVRYDGL